MKNLILLVCLIALSGCVELDTKLLINEDGSGKVSNKFKLSPQAVKMLEVDNRSRYYNDLPSQYLSLDETKIKELYLAHGLSIDGFKVETSDDGSKTVSYDVPFKDFNVFSKRSFNIYGFELNKLDDNQSSLAVFDPNLIEVFMSFSKYQREKKDMDLKFLAKDAKASFTLESKALKKSNAENNQWHWKASDYLNTKKSFAIPRASFNKNFVQEDYAIFQIPEEKDVKLKVNYGYDSKGVVISQNGSQQDNKLYFNSNLVFPGNSHVCSYQIPMINEYKTGDDFEEIRRRGRFGSRWQSNRKRSGINFFIAMSPTPIFKNLKAVKGSYKVRFGTGYKSVVLDKIKSLNNKQIDHELLKDLNLSVAIEESTQVFSRNQSYLIKSYQFLDGDGNILPNSKDEYRRNFVTLDDNSKFRIELFTEVKEYDINFTKEF